MMNYVAIACAVALSGCAKRSTPPQDITPDVSVTASSSGSGGSGGASTSVASSVAVGSGGIDMGDGPDVSGSRLKIASYAGSDGSKFIRSDAYDSALDVLCSFVPAKDGTVRCMPTTFQALIMYADPGCVTEVLSPIFDCGVDATAIMSAQDASSECPPFSNRSFRVSNPRIAAAYMRISSECSAAGTRLIVDAEEIPPTGFVEMSSVVETP